MRPHRKVSKRHRSPSQPSAPSPPGRSDGFRPNRPTHAASSPPPWTVTFWIAAWTLVSPLHRRRHHRPRPLHRAAIASLAVVKSWASPPRSQTASRWANSSQPSGAPALICMWCAAMLASPLRSVPDGDWTPMPDSPPCGAPSPRSSSPSSASSAPRNGPTPRPRCFVRPPDGPRRSAPPGARLPHRARGGAHRSQSCANQVVILRRDVEDDGALRLRMAARPIARSPSRRVNRIWPAAPRRPTGRRGLARTDTWG